MNKRFFYTFLINTLILVMCQFASADAGSEVQQLINKTMPIAEELLVEHGEFFPFGGALKTDGEVVTISGLEGIETQPESADVIDTLKIGLRIGAENKQYKATALLYKVSVIPPGKTDNTDAIAIEVDHADGMSVIMLFPYTIAEGAVDIGDVFAQGGHHRVFGER